MGKTSTIKASKKKTVAKKKDTVKKVKADPAASGQDSALKTEETQVTAELKGSKDSAKAVKAGPSIQKKPVLLSELILKKFDTWQPDNLFVKIPDQSIIPDAPPYISGKDDQEINRKRTLLFKTFDMKIIIAEGERYAAEKAAAEKAEAERIAAEKAAAEKAEAERIAAEKAAAEKAEAERIAAEKAAAALERKKAIELQQASTPKVKITYDQPAQPVQPALPAKVAADPVDISIKIGAGCLALLVLILLGTSLCNSQKFYIKPAKNGIEIWQGRFAPMGEKQLISLAGVKSPEKLKKIYSDLDVYPIICRYFLNKADAVLDAPGIPDFEGMKHYINLAEPYAMTRELRDAADLRLNSMAKTLLIYKADIAVSRGSIADLEAAVGFLYKAKAMNSDKAQAESLDKKISAATGKLEQLKAQPQAAATQTK